MSAPRPGLLARVASALSLRSGAGGVTQFGQVGWTIVQGQGPGAYQGTGRAARLKGFEQNPVAHACARVVTDLVGSVPLQGYTVNAAGDATVLKPDHPLSQLLERPGLGINASRHRKLTLTQFLFYGNAYWHLERQGRAGLPVALRLVHPEYVQYVYRERETLMPVAYEWTDAMGARRQSPATDILHWRDLTAAEDFTFGFPRVVAALLDLMTDDEASQYVRQVLSNHGTPGIAIMLDGAIDADVAKALEERWQEKFVNRGGRGRAAFLGGATKLEKIGFDLKELEFPALRAIAREDICAVFGVDPRMVGVASASGREQGMSGVQFAEARQRLYLQTGAPLMLDLQAELNETLAPEYGADVYVRHDPDKLADITENMEQTSARAVKELLAGGITIEEFRETTGRDPDMDPKHYVLLPVASTLRTVQEAQTDAATPTPEPPDPVEMAAAVAAAKQPKALPAGDGGTSGSEPPKDAPPKDDAKRATRTLTRIVPRGMVLTEAQRVALWGSFDARATAQEGVYRVAALTELRRDQQAVADAFAAATRAEGDEQTGPADPEDVPDDGALEQVLRWVGVYFAGSISGEAFRHWKQAFERVIGQTMQDAGTELAAQVGVQWDLENPKVQDAIARRTARLVGHVTETTRDEIRGLIASGRQAGLGVKTIARMINDAVFEGRNEARATLIAQTELVGALNEGEYTAAQATGVITTKAWLSKRDPKVRDDHAACDEEGDIPLSARFAATGMLYPGEAGAPADQVCRCRCTILFGTGSD